MGALGPGDRLVWTVVALLALGTYALRLSFIQLYGTVEAFPPWVERALAYVPAAVMAALVFPALFALDGTVAGLVNARVLAGGLAAVVAWRTRSMLLTIVVGMGVLWLVTALSG